MIRSLTLPYGPLLPVSNYVLPHSRSAALESRVIRGGPFEPHNFAMVHHPLNPSFAFEVQQSFAKQAIMQLIGGELSRIDPGVVEITIPYKAELTQQNGYLHAGIVTTIADTACGYAAYSLMPAGSEVLSVEFKVNLLRPAKGEKFRARAEVIKPGKTLTVVRADVFSITGAAVEHVLVASMLGTMFCVRNDAAEDRN